MKHVGVHADMRWVVDIPELGPVGSEDDELIITLFLGCVRAVLQLYHSTSCHRQGNSSLSC